MSESKNDLTYTMNIFRYILIVLGCYPDNKGNISVLNKSLFIALLVYSFYLTIYSIIYEFPNLPEVSINVTALFAVVGATCKFANFITRPKQYTELSNIVIKEFWFTNSSTSQEEKDIIHDYAKMSLQFNKFLAGLEFTCALLTIARAFIRMYIFSDSGHQRTLIFRIWVPNDIIDIYADPYYQIIFIAQATGTLGTVAIIAALDCTFIFLVLNTSAQYKILCLKINNYENNTYRGSLSAEQFLKSCIAQHQKLNNVCVELEEFLSLCIFGDFVAIVPFLCFTGFVFITYSASYYSIVETVIFLVSGFIQLFAYCYAADVLTTEASNIGDAAYTSNWLNSPLKVRKLLILVIARAQKPNYLTAWKLFPVTISTFESISRTAMSYLTVLNTMSD